MDIASSLHQLERKVLPVLEKESEVSKIAAATQLQEIEVKRALLWLSNKELVVISETREELVSLDKNGLKYKEEGLPEIKTLKLLAEQDYSTAELVLKGIAQDEINIIIGSLKKKAAVNITKENNSLQLSITEPGKKLLEKVSPEEQFLNKKFPLLLSDIKDLDKLAFDNLKKRKDIVKQETKKTVTAELTPKGKELLQEGITGDAGVDTLTKEMIKNGSWKNKTFRPYDVASNVPKITRGRKHFVNEAIEYVKSIWLEMGFKEMSGTHIQTSFWDLDALFVPQDHPAREMQDTYYLKKPKTGKISNKEVYERVKAVHENGGDTGSKGWQTTFDEDLSQTNLLRTHTTVLSARMLAEIKKQGYPAKFFVVGKVYRNETLDWKHLFEFHQVDGIVIDPNANLRNLKGYLEAFYKKMGFPKVRMRPAHFPYTEPSIEVEVWHPVKNEWVEMGGAGIFRPEVTKTLIGEEIPVLAWGLGLERIISPYYGINDIRELYGNDLKQLRTIKKYNR